MAGPLTSDAGSAADPNRWAVLAVLGTAQLMVVLDATIVNIALPSAQKALDFSTADREWIVTAYALAFGSLLLLGGKLGDLFGRKWTFIAGLSGFAIVSAIGGLAQNFDTLVSARALQDMFGALLGTGARGAYATHVLPGLLVIGIGMGCIFAPAIGTATLGLEVRETGVASAMVNTSQQVGGAVGLALLSTVSASAVAGYARTHSGLPGLAGAAAAHGYTTGFWWAAGIFVAGLLLTLLILPGKAEARECTLKTAVAHGIAYALHLEAAAAAVATHTLRASTRPPPPDGSSPDRDGSSDPRDTPAANPSP
jgi:MFS family permease